MESASVRAHAAVPFMSPMSETAVDAAIAALALPPRARVLETGCGAAELLLRVLEAHPGATGVGVDLDRDVLERARRAAARRLPGRAPELIAAPAGEAALPPGGHDLVINVASSHAHGGWPAALGVLAGLVRPGGLVLLGEGFWAREPSPAVLDALGGATVGELPAGLPALVAEAGRAGLTVVATAEAGAADWAAYEEGLAAEAARHPDPEAQAYARRIRERRALPGGTDTMGFALLTLRRG
ncbi:class I SAM-dependent methyltransferase [Baekduia soli]|uniref:Class I SAM-dependent methyltransferase n=1 Tax=Baekduia soli TaxID=496014 RepID=A0A5B8UBU8_9ACTN|nr:class I SAM-dependent methyltransferase [Baekduia soli]QEC50121.1 class I SAM-dependent methyltransferase [Baekduia soli]